MSERPGASDPGPAGPTPPTALVGALRELLGALVELLLRHGVTLPMFLPLLKEAYVKVARERFPPEARRRESDSRVSLLTGVHRKDVRRMREEPAQGELIPAAVNVGTRIVGAWLGDPELVDDEGLPRPLPRASRAGEGPSFDALVASVTRDLAPGSVLAEWLRLGIAELDAEDRVHLRVEGFVPTEGFDEKAFYVGRNLRDHIASAANNLAGLPPMLERSVYYEELSETSVRELEELGERLSMEALRAFDRRARALRQRDAGRGSLRVTLGAFFFRGRAREQREDGE